jgi:uncharacterized protein
MNIGLKFRSRIFGLALGLLTFLLMATTAFADDQLHKAAHAGDLAKVKTILSKGVNPDARDSYGGTALHAAMFQNNIEIVELLLANGFSPNAQGPRNGYTPLHDSVWANNIPAAKLLLARGAKLDIKGKDGMTPLEKAVAENKPAMAQLLKDAATRR